MRKINGLTVRAWNVLVNLLGRLGDPTKVEVASLRYSDLAEASNCGASTLREIQEWLAVDGLELKDPPRQDIEVEAAIRLLESRGFKVIRKPA